MGLACIIGVIAMGLDFGVIAMGLDFGVIAMGWQLDWIYEDENTILI